MNRNGQRKLALATAGSLGVVCIIGVVLTPSASAPGSASPSASVQPSASAPASRVSPEEPTPALPPLPPRVEQLYRRLTTGLTPPAANPLFRSILPQQEQERSRPKLDEPSCGVFVRNGDVFARPACASQPRFQPPPARRLTTSGRDSLPVESPDGQHVAFVRRDSAEGGTRLMSVPRNGGEEAVLFDPARRRVIAGERTAWPLSEESRVQALYYSDDGKRLYLLTFGWGVVMAVYEISLGTKTARLLTASNGLHVIHECAGTPYQGMLIVRPHKYWDGMGSYDWHWLMTPSGKESDPIGPTAGHVLRFFAEKCQLGESPPRPEPEEIPPLLARDRFTCKETVISRKRFDFLDGTSRSMWVFRYVHEDGSPGVITHDLDGALEIIREWCPDKLSNAGVAL